MVNILGVLNNIQVIFKKDARDLMDEALGVRALDAEDMIIVRWMRHSAYQLSMIRLRYQPLFESSPQSSPQTNG